MAESNLPSPQIGSGVGVLGVALRLGNAGNPPKYPRQVVVRHSRVSGRTLWRCAGGGRCTGRSGVAPTWEVACAQVIMHFNETSHEEK